VKLAQRVAAEALMRHGQDWSYEATVESPDSIAWLRQESADLAAMFPCTADDVVAFLIDVAWLDLEEEPDDSRGRAVHADIAAALGLVAEIERLSPCSPELARMIEDAP
jgi:hypothetical protein